MRFYCPAIGVLLAYHKPIILPKIVQIILTNKILFDLHIFEWLEKINTWLLALKFEAIDMLA
jgi:hypothetical protein